jgi:hypothetical protein
MEALMELVERAINGVELPDYPGVPDSKSPGRTADHLLGQAVVIEVGDR